MYKRKNKMLAVGFYHFDSKPTEDEIMHQITSIEDSHSIRCGLTYANHYSIGLCADESGRWLLQVGLYKFKEPLTVVDKVI